MNLILRFFLTFSSVSFFLIVYLVQNEINPLKTVLCSCYTWITYIGYVFIPFLLTFISLCICKLLAKSEIRKVNSIEVSNNDFLANYLAFFFVALSISKLISFYVVFGMTILFTFVSRVSYFNPMFLVLGYNFYYIYTAENVKVMLISKKKLRDPKVFDVTTVRRINDYTFIDI